MGFLPSLQGLGDLHIQKKYDVTAKCEYHGGVGGHSVENCTAFKDKVQLLINADPVKFERLVNGHQKY